MATNPYTSVSASGYNSSPPPDAGETTTANQIFWSTIKTKLADVIKTLSDAINTNVLAAFGKVINTDANENNSMAGSLAFASSTLTIATGSVTATRSHHLIAAETGTTDDLANITTGSVSDFCHLVIRNDSGDTITVKHAATGAGEIHLSDDADFAMSGDMSVTLKRRGADWYEEARSEVLQATQAQMEAGSANTVAVTPGRLHNHPSAAKVWGSVDRSAGTPSLQSPSYNTTSVADDGVANTIVTIATDFSSAVYSVGAQPIDAADANAGGICRVHTRVAGAFDVEVYDHAGTTEDTDDFTYRAFGDQ